MAKTIADMFREKGRREGRKEEAIRSRRKIMLHQLRRRFGDLPPRTVATINRTTSVPQLIQWLDRVLVVKTLAAMDIG
jgi:hypothetical protein